MNSTNLPLTTKRLILRNFTLADKTAYVAMTQHLHYQRFYSEQDCSKDKATLLVNLFINQSNELPRTKYQLAVCLESGEFIGTCGVRLEGEYQASFGFGFAIKYQSQGFATEAAKALIDFSFRQLKVHRLYAQTIEGNTEAMALCEKLGFNLEAKLVESHYFKQQWWNGLIYALLEHSWSANKF